MGATLLKSVVDFSNASVTMGANLLTQSALLVGAGLFVAWILRHKGAALRSAILRVTLAAILVCPLASLGLQALGVPGLRFNLPRATMQPVEVPAPAAAIETIPLEPVEFLMPVDTDVRPVRMPQTEVSVAAQDGSFDPTAGATAVSSDAPAYRLSRLASFYIVLVALWWAVSGLLLVRLMMAHIKMTRVSRSAKEAPSCLSAMCEALAKDMQVRRPTLLTSPHVKCPCLIGFLRPTILLPESDGAADPIASREVLVHELAHLAQRDFAWNLVSRMARALLFFQPLLPRLTRRIQQASDDVADDYVVQHELDRRSYAHLLVDIAERLQPTPSEALAGVGVINLKWSLERRVQRILDTTRDLSIRIGLRTAVAVIALALCATLAAGFVGAGRSSQVDPEEVLDTARAYVEEGESHEELGEWEQAAQAYEQAVATLESAPDVAPDNRYELLLALGNLADVLEDAGRAEEAEEVRSKRETVRENLATHFPHILRERRNAEMAGPTVDFKVRISTPGEYQLYLQFDGHDIPSDRFYAWIEELADGPGGTTADYYGFSCVQDWNFGTNSWDGEAEFELNKGDGGVQVASVWSISSPGDYTLRFGGPRDGAAVDAFVFQRANLLRIVGYGPEESTMTADGIFLEEEGRVVAEAEHYTSRTSHEGVDWLVVPNEDPGDVPHSNFRGNGYLQVLPDSSPTMEEKLASLVRGVEADPDNPDAWQELGINHWWARDDYYDEAIADFTKVIELNPRHWGGWWFRACVYSALGEHEKAAADYLTAGQLELEPDVEAASWITPAYTWRQAAFHQFASGDIEGYRRTCESILQHYGDTQDPVTADKVAWRCAYAPSAVADLERPVQLARIAVQSDETNCGYLITLGATLCRAGHYQEALDVLQDQRIEASKYRANLFRPFFLAMACHRLGLAGEAAEWLDIGIESTEKLERANRVNVLQEFMRDEAEALIRGEEVVIAKNK